ncbi:hypothetical protein [Streptomyces sp. NPDC059814]|uniref:hypothetical protein n=1 Tax=Streptomyces sp. NPDC059814 TaxID=3346959 RepID=UPI00364F4D7D
MSVSASLIPAAVSAAVGAAMSLKGPDLLVVLAVLLTVVVIGYAVSVLPDFLRYRLHAKAVEKVEAADLPALFRAFSPIEAEPDPPDDAAGP